MNTIGIDLRKQISKLNELRPTLSDTTIKVLKVSSIILSIGALAAISLSAAPIIVIVIQSVAITALAIAIISKKAKGDSYPQARVTSIGASPINNLSANPSTKATRASSKTESTSIKSAPKPQLTAKNTDVTSSQTSIDMSSEVDSISALEKTTLQQNSGIPMPPPPPPNTKAPAKKIDPKETSKIQNEQENSGIPTPPPLPGSKPPLAPPPPPSGKAPGKKVDPKEARKRQIEEVSKNIENLTKEKENRVATRKALYNEITELQKQKKGMNGKLIEALRYFNCLKEKVIDLTKKYELHLSGLALFQKGLVEVKEAINANTPFTFQSFTFEDKVKAKNDFEKLIADYSQQTLESEAAVRQAHNEVDQAKNHSVFGSLTAASKTLDDLDDKLIGLTTKLNQTIDQIFDDNKQLQILKEQLENLNSDSNGIKAKTRTSAAAGGNHLDVLKERLQKNKASNALPSIGAEFGFAI